MENIALSDTLQRLIGGAYFACVIGFMIAGGRDGKAPLWRPRFRSVGGFFRA